MSSLIPSIKSSPFLVSLILCFCLSGCYQDAPEEILSSSGTAKLNVITRSVTNNDLHYPLIIYAFDENGQLKTQKVVNSSTESVKMNLAEGKYRLVAVSGAAGYDIPGEVELSSNIATKNGNYSDVELAVGRADVVVSGTSSATIQMALQVAGINIELDGLAEDVSAVVVNIAKQAQSVTFDGTLGEGGNSTIECKYENGIWKTGEVFVFPGSASSTVFSITTTDDSGTHTYGYTYSSAMKAGQPYRLNGTFSSGVIVNGVIEYSGWNNEIVLGFNFGPGISETGGGDAGGNGGTTPSDTDLEVTNIPQAGSVLNGHVVALVENASSSSADVILLSVSEWGKVSSGNSETPTESTNRASEYSESGMTGWRVPTKDEATKLKTSYGGANLTYLNNIINEAGGTLLAATEENGGNARYLCENATYTFTFNGTSSSITQAGGTTKYRLRLVKKIRVTVK